MQKLLPIFFILALLASCGEDQSGAENTAIQSNTAPASVPEKALPVPYDANAPDNHLRPNYHFTPPAGWMNDPNGMIYHEGEYHLFYQYYPDENKWGPMHWGHAISQDLVSWEHLPIALYPDELGYIFSGSAVLDRQNSSGLGTADNPPMVAIFTYHDMAAEKAGREDFQSQGIAYSTDKGRTWTKYGGNPVIPNQGVRDFRDPKVIWDAAHNQWVMVLAAQDRVQFFGSANLTDWTFLSEFGERARNHSGVWECPELFPLTVMETQEESWVLTVSINPGGANGGSGTFYFPGDWDGVNFNPKREAMVSPTDTVNWVDYGRDNYAGVTFSAAPDGRRIFMGWMSNWDYAQEVPTQSWRSAMTVPRDLSLHDTDFGTRLWQQPAKELEKLRGKRLPLEFPRIGDGITNIDLRELESDGAYEIDLLIDIIDSDAEEFSLTLSNQRGDQFYRIGYSRASGVTNALFTDRRQSGNTGFNKKFAPEGLTIAPRWTNAGTLRIHAFIDRTSAETFFDDGDPVMTDIFFPEELFTLLTLEVSGSSGEGMPEGWSLLKGEIWGLEK